jgi:hypothetical protein
VVFLLREFGIRSTPFPLLFENFFSVRVVSQHALRVHARFIGAGGPCYLVVMVSLPAFFRAKTLVEPFHREWGLASRAVSRFLFAEALLIFWHPLAPFLGASVTH